MTKFKTSPNQGTKTIGLPVVGDVDFVDGVAEIDDSNVDELLKHNFGFKLISGNPQKKIEKFDEEDEGESEAITKEQLMRMTAEGMKSFMIDAFELDKDQVAEITKGKKKEEVADEILERINAIPPTE